MAVRKTSARKPRRRQTRKNNRVSLSMVFWLLFFIVLIIAFFTLLPKVKKGVNLNLPQIQTVTEQPELQELVDTDGGTVSERNIQPENTRHSENAAPPAKPPEKPDEKPVVRDTPPPPPQKPAEQPPSSTERRPPAQQPASPPPVSTPERHRDDAQPPETRDRTIYFMQEGNGDLSLVKVNRKIAVSDSPLLDSINALLAGPNAEEKSRGFISCIPSNARLISARVNNDTVFLNFNEEFRYNTFGREGSAAQLRQIVWTATEFPNVNNVQIMIEGTIVDFLVEGIMIRNPIGR